MFLNTVKCVYTFLTCFLPTPVLWATFRRNCNPGQNTHTQKYKLYRTRVTAAYITESVNPPGSYVWGLEVFSHFNHLPQLQRATHTHVHSVNLSYNLGHHAILPWKEIAKTDTVDKKKLNLIGKDECDFREQAAIGNEDIRGSLHVVSLEEGAEVSERRVKLRLEDRPDERCWLL